MTGIEYGVVINKVNNLEDYRNNYLRDIKELGVNVLGVIPFNQDLTYVPVSYIAEKLQARIITGESGLNRKVKNVFVGAMSGDTASRLPLWKKEGKVVITGGDRSDMVVAALDRPPPVSFSDQ
jgi:BioD-like phosphotransacetylase family protein